eukprot:NODE_8088_length_724_cov_90.713810_g7836_i0.p1 GENE.NODE_8088_length_724_cov_90.713810_g7836_i0~~NODE_8088_length_724_cov_90.713810_g7836_i0.p1  ORF type:complete len:162 (+),score=33.69 NODE_8088_length_724_cov_90.713810_g7836_i0:69-554(+)
MEYSSPTVVTSANFPSTQMYAQAPAASYAVAAPTLVAQPVYSQPIAATHTHYEEASHSVIGATVAPPATYVDTQPTGAVYTPTYMPDMASLTQYAYGNGNTKRGDTFTNTAAYTPKSDKMDTRINSKFTPEHPGAFHPGYRTGCGLGYLHRHPAKGATKRM